jgi:hypothetical protein
MDYYYDNDTQDNIYKTTANTFFTVEYNRVKTILLIVFAIFPFLVFLFAKNLLTDLYSRGLTNLVYMFVFFLVLTSLMFLVIFLVSVGTKIDVQGNVITIRKWFILKDVITISNVSLCEVIYNLTVHSRYGSRTYNKIVLHYNGKKVSVTDDVFTNWNRLRDYMIESGKATTIDGSSKLSKFLENLMRK